MNKTGNTWNELFCVFPVFLFGVEIMRFRSFSFWGGRNYVFPAFFFLGDRNYVFPHTFVFYGSIYVFPELDWT